MSIHVGFAPRRNFLRSATASEIHAASARSEIAHPVVVAHARELRERVNEALRAGERHLIVDCESWSEPDVTLLSALILCARRSREQGAVLEFINVSGELLASVRDLHLEERLGLT